MDEGRAMGEWKTLPGGTGAAARMKRGERLEIKLAHGLQVVDFWSMNAADFGEYGSMSHSRSHWFRLTPRPGDPIVTNRRNPIATLAEDSTGGAHDTLLPCCDAKRYNQFGFVGYHRNCSDNFREGLAALGVEPPPIFLPINLFMQVPLGADGTLMIVPPRQARRPRAARGRDGHDRRDVGLPVRPAAAQRARLQGARRGLPGVLGRARGRRRTAPATVEVETWAATNGSGTSSAGSSS
jgi:uncharacterized protein